MNKKEECMNGSIGINPNMKLADFCKMYLEIKKNVLSPRTFYDYEKNINEFIIPNLGHIKLSALKTIHIQKYIDYLHGDIRRNKDGTLNQNNTKLSEATIKRRLTILQSVSFISTLLFFNFFKGILIALIIIQTLPNFNISPSFILYLFLFKGYFIPL